MAFVQRLVLPMTARAVKKSCPQAYLAIDGGGNSSAAQQCTQESERVLLLLLDEVLLFPPDEYPQAEDEELERRDERDEAW